MAGLGSVGQLFIELRADTSKLTKDLQASQKKMAAIGAGLAATGIAIGAALFKAASSTAELGDAMQKAGIRTGLTTEQLSGLKFAAEQSGSSFESLTKGLKRLAANANDAGMGIGEAKVAFETLGVSVTDAGGKLRPMNTLLLESADKFSALTNDTQAAALAQDIFGKAGVDLLPLLKSGRAGIAALTAEAAELGITFTQVAADDSAAFEDATNRLGRSFEGLTKTIGVELLPDVTKLVDKFTAGTKALKDFTAEHPMLIKAAAGLSVALTGAGGAVIGLVALGKGLPLVKAGFAALGATGGAVFLAAGAFAAVGAAAFVFRNELAGGLTNALAEIVRSFGWVAGAAGSLADAVGLDGLAGKLQTAKLSAFQSAENFSDMSDVLLDVAPDTSAVATAFSAELVPALQDTVDLNKDLGNELEDVKLTLSELASAFPSTYEVARHQAEVTKDAFSAFNEQIVASGTALAMLGSDISNIPTPPPMPDVFPEDEMNAAFGRWKAVSANIAADQAARTADLKKGLTDATKDVRDAAGKMFDNMFLKGENVFRSIGNLLKGGGLSIGRAIFQDLTAAFGGPILDAFRNFFKATLGEVIKNFGQRIGGAIAGALGGGAGSAVSGAVSGGASAAKGVAGSAAAVATGGVSALAQGIGAFAGTLIAGLFQKNKQVAIEENTRRTHIILTDMMNDRLQPMKETLQWQREIQTDLLGATNDIRGTSFPALQGAVESSGDKLANAVESLSSSFSTVANGIISTVDSRIRDIRVEMDSREVGKGLRETINNDGIEGLGPA